MNRRFVFLIIGLLLVFSGCHQERSPDSGISAGPGTNVDVRVLKLQNLVAGAISHHGLRDTFLNQALQIVLD